MSVVTLKIVVGNISDVIASFDRIKVYRCTTGRTGSFTEISTPSTRPVLESSKSSYTFLDSVGDPAYWYKCSYFNSSTPAESDLSSVMQGSEDPALAIVSVDELKAVYLTGVHLTDEYGDPFPDSVYEWHIKSAVSLAEHRLNIPIRPKSFIAEKHDYYKEDYNKYIFMHLNEYPVIAVDKIQMVLPGEIVVQTFDPTWIHLDKSAGHIQIVPGPGSAGSVLLGAAGQWLPFIYGGNRFIPDVFRIDYCAGFDPAEGVPADIKDLIGMQASIGPLNLAGELILGAGIANMSMAVDGLSQSLGTMASPANGAYGARVKQYQERIRELERTIKDFYKGVRMVIV